MAVEPRYQKIIDLLKERLLAELPEEIHSLVLFGSVARGEATDDSDIDILVVTNADLDTERRIDEITYDSILEFETYVQLVLFTVGDLERNVELRSWFAIDLLSQGIILYDNGTFQGIRESVDWAIAGVSPR
jgi:predicted nucleotidyltransferase